MIKYLIRIPILKRLIPSIGIRLLKVIKKNRGFFNIDGFKMYLDFLDPIDRAIILNKTYEVLFYVFFSSVIFSRVSEHS